MTVSSATVTPTHQSTSVRIPGGFAAAVIGPLALAAANLCFAVLTRNGHPEDTAGYLALVREQPALVEAGSALGLIASLLLVPAIWAVVGVLQHGRSRLANVGGWMMASGYVLAVALAVESLVAVSVAQSSGPIDGFIDATDNGVSLAATAMYAVFGIGALVGGLLLGIAMLRQRTLPRWCGIALIASEPVRVIGLLTEVDTLTAVASLLILVAFVGTLRAPAPGPRAPSTQTG